MVEVMNQQPDVKLQFSYWSNQKKKYPMKTERNICGKPNHTVLLVKIKITNYEIISVWKKNSNLFCWLVELWMLDERF